MCAKRRTVADPNLICQTQRRPPVVRPCGRWHWNTRVCKRSRSKDFASNCWTTRISSNGRWQFSGHPTHCIRAVISRWVCSISCLQTTNSLLSYDYRVYDGQCHGLRGFFWPHLCPIHMPKHWWQTSRQSFWDCVQLFVADGGHLMTRYMSRTYNYLSIFVDNVNLVISINICHRWAASVVRSFVRTLCAVRKP